MLRFNEFKNDKNQTKKFLLYLYDRNYDHIFVRDDNFISSIHHILLSSDSSYRLARNVHKLFQYFTCVFDCEFNTDAHFVLSIFDGDELDDSVCDYYFQIIDKRRKLLMHKLKLETALSKDFYDKLELDVYLIVLADVDEFMIEQLYILNNISNECYNEYIKVRRIFGLFLIKMVELSRLKANNNDSMYGFDLECNDDDDTEFLREYLVQQMNW